jgi:GDP-L-fucose synthase
VPSRCVQGPSGGAERADGDIVARLAHTFLAAARSGASRVRVAGGPDTLLDLVHVRDVAAACLCLLASSGGEAVVNVGSGEAIPLRELAALVRDLVAPGVAVEFEHANAAESPVLDPGTLRRLGWRPRVGVGDGVAEVCGRLQAAADRQAAGAVS